MWRATVRGDLQGVEGSLGSVRSWECLIIKCCAGTVPPAPACPMFCNYLCVLLEAVGHYVEERVSNQT